jgi:adenosine deaminase
VSLKDYLQAAPKAELHLHLEGSIRQAAVGKLARRNGVALPDDVWAVLERRAGFRGFRHFVETYVAISRCLRTAGDYEMISYDVGADLARQNVRYAEVTFSPSTHVFDLGVPWDACFGGLTRGRRRAEHDFGVQIRWVFDIVRDPTHAPFVTRAAVDGMAEGVVALGVVGLETVSPTEAFAPWFEQARAAGLHTTPHAGETTGPGSVWSALRVLGAERIGHGVRSIEDPALVAYLAEQRVPLEVCPTSNVRLGVYPSLAQHPLRRLHDAGVVVTVNSDDPALFNTSLNDELATLPDAFGLGVEAIDEIILNGVRCSFLPAERKRALEAEFRDELARLKAIYLKPE